MMKVVRVVGIVGCLEFLLWGVFAARVEGETRLQLVVNELNGRAYLAVSDRLVMRFRADADALDIARLHKGLGAQVVTVIPELRVHVVQLPVGVSVDDARAYYRGSPIISYAEPDWVRFPTFVPNDPLFPQQWAHKVTNSTAAWDISLGDPEVVIGIIDTGVELNHEDMQPNLWQNPNEIPGNRKDDDGNGYEDDVYGYNFADKKGDPSPSTRSRGGPHGTHVAGISAAVVNNGRGVAGVAGRCRIMALNVFGDNEFTSDSLIVEAIRYAANMGAFVINMSLGGPGRSSVIQDAVSFAYRPSATGRPGLVIVAATGNDDMEIGPDNPFTPVCEDGGENMVLGVSSTGPKDIKAYYSNYGEPTCVDVCAPGGDQRQRLEDGILSSIPGNRYEFYQGTSMAAPFVAGLAALMKSVAGDLSNVMIRDVIIASADNIDKLNPNHAGKLGSGRVNVEQAVKMAVALSKGFEPNNNLQQARKNAEIRVGFTLFTLLSSPSDPDYFYLPISTQQKVSITTQSLAPVSIGLRVFQEFGQTYMPKVLPNGALNVTFNARPGRYYVLVYPVSNVSPWPLIIYKLATEQVK